MLIILDLILTWPSVCPVLLYHAWLIWRKLSCPESLTTYPLNENSKTKWSWLLKITNMYYSWDLVPMWLYPKDMPLMCSRENAQQIQQDSLAVARQKVPKSWLFMLHQVYFIWNLEASWYFHMCRGLHLNVFVWNSLKRGKSHCFHCCHLAL